MDRYGKILKQIFYPGLGWDGNFNGQTMPATDYWFILQYNDNDGKEKKIKSHFSLIR